METNNKDWNQPGTWAEELVEQSKHQAYRYQKMFYVCVGIIAALLVSLVGTNIYWIHQFTSYEYVSQDGSGVNSINTGNQEDVHIGTENEN